MRGQLGPRARRVGVGSEIPGQGAIHPPGTGATSGFTSIQVWLIGLPRLQLIQQTLRVHPMPQMWLHRGPSSEIWIWIRGSTFALNDSRLRVETIDYFLRRYREDIIKRWAIEGDMKRS